MTPGVSALYVRADGPYPRLVADWWDEARDARLYAGPNPVVAHPPCGTWGCMAPVNQARYGHRIGGDGGCFAAAVTSVRRWGGVLEHPAGTRAWPRFGLLSPTRGSWTRSLLRPDEWVTEVDQLQYGHRARKRTWLVYVGQSPPPLDWRRGKPTAWVSTDRPRAVLAAMGIDQLSKREAATTPEPFARLLVSLAASAGRVAA